MIAKSAYLLISLHFRSCGFEWGNLLGQLTGRGFGDRARPGFAVRAAVLAERAPRGARVALEPSSEGIRPCELNREDGARRHASSELENRR
jgi:hypothetical protein